MGRMKESGGGGGFILAVRRLRAFVPFIAFFMFATLFTVPTVSHQ